MKRILDEEVEEDDNEMVIREKMNEKKKGSKIVIGEGKGYEKMEEDLEREWDEKNDEKMEGVVVKRYGYGDK